MGSMVFHNIQMQSLQEESLEIDMIPEADEGFLKVNVYISKMLMSKGITGRVFNTGQKDGVTTTPKTADGLVCIPVCRML